MESCPNTPKMLSADKHLLQSLDGVTRGQARGKGKQLIILLSRRGDNAIRKTNVRNCNLTKSRNQ